MNNTVSTANLPSTHGTSHTTQQARLRAHHPRMLGAEQLFQLRVAVHSDADSVLDAVQQLLSFVACAQIHVEHQRVVSLNLRRQGE